MDGMVTKEQPLVLPTNRREALLMKLNDFKVDNLTAKESDHCKKLTRANSIIFDILAWSKFGISSEQLNKLTYEDRNELAAVIYEESKIFAFLQMSVFLCVPLIGWGILGLLLNPNNFSFNYYVRPFWLNMRYFFWYGRMRNRYGKNFEPISY